MLRSIPSPFAGHDSLRRHARRLVRPGALAVVISLVGLLAAPVTASAVPLPGVTIVALVNSVQSTNTELPVGANFEYLVNDTCATETCADCS